MSQTHWKKLTNPDYIGAYSLTPGEDMVVTIDRVVNETVTGNQGRKEQCTVAYLRGQKPMILNKTNCKTLSTLFGSPYIEDWAGKSFTLYGTTTQFGGDTVECLRIRKAAPKRVKETLSADRLPGALDAVRSGQWTIQQVLSRFELTAEQIAQFERIKHQETAT